MKSKDRRFCAVQKSPRSVVVGEWQALRLGRTLLPPARSLVTLLKAFAGKRRGNSLGVTREVNLKAAITCWETSLYRCATSHQEQHLWEQNIPKSCSSQGCRDT